MNQLEELINEEIQVLTHSALTWDRFAEKVFALLKDYLSPEDYQRNVDDVTECFNEVERFAFTQGYLRGIAAVKGGAV